MAERIQAFFFSRELQRELTPSTHNKSAYVAKYDPSTEFAFFVSRVFVYSKRSMSIRITARCKERKKVHVKGPQSCSDIVNVENISTASTGCFHACSYTGVSEMAFDISSRAILKQLTRRAKDIPLMTSNKCIPNIHVTLPRESFFQFESDGPKQPRPVACSKGNVKAPNAVWENVSADFPPPFRCKMPSRLKPRHGKKGGLSRNLDISVCAYVSLSSRQSIFIMQNGVTSI